jgi:hypothetical protein
MDEARGPASLRTRLRDAGRRLGSREAEHATALSEAQVRAAKLRGAVADAVAGFNEGARAAGAPHLVLEVGEPRVDDKHLRAIEFELRRGRHRAIVTVKSRGEVTLVGPFKAGKPEGPCQTFPWDSDADLQRALGDFLERFAEEAATP